MSYAGRAVAVTGAQGYIGAALVVALRAAGADVRRVSSRPLADLSGTQALQGMIDDPALWDRIVADSEVIFHLAGNTSVYAATDDPAASLRSTVLPITLLTAAAAAADRHPRVVLASTATLYGMGGVDPVDETTPPRPVTNYDLHKWFAEEQLRLAGDRGIIDGISLRLANVYGPSAGASSAVDRNILSRIAAAALAGDPISAFGGGDYLRDYVYIDDVVEAFMTAGMTETGFTGMEGGRAFNVAGGRGVTVAHAFGLVAACAGRTTGQTVAVESAPWPAGADRIELRNFVGDIGAIRRTLGWQPQVSIEDGVNRLVAAIAQARTSS